MNRNLIQNEIWQVFPIVRSLRMDVQSCRCYTHPGEVKHLANFQFYNCKMNMDSFATLNSHHQYVDSHVLKCINLTLESYHSFECCFCSLVSINAPFGLGRQVLSTESYCTMQFRLQRSRNMIPHDMTLTKVAWLHVQYKKSMSVFRLLVSPITGKLKGKLTRCGQNEPTPSLRIPELSSLLLIIKTISEMTHVTMK